MKKATRIVIVLSIVCALLICSIVGLLTCGNANSRSKVDASQPSLAVSDLGDKREIVCWGDSLTQGVGADAAIIETADGRFDASFMSYPEILEQLTGIRTYNFGVSGATSAEIAYMQGGWELENGYEGESEGVGEGEPGDQPKYEGEAQSERFEFDLIMNMVKLQAAQHKGDILIIEMGSNGGWDMGFEQLIAQYRAMIDHAGCKQYIIIGDTDDPGSSYADPYDWPQDHGAGIQETAWEAALREEFGEHFINMRLFLIEHGLDVAGLKPTGQDAEYAEFGWVSDQLRSDWTHLNSYGYYAQAVGVYGKGKELGYWA